MQMRVMVIECLMPITHPAMRIIRPRMDTLRLTSIGGPISLQLGLTHTRDPISPHHG
jgi:hypothetical protein